MSDSWYHATASVYLTALTCEVPGEVSRHSHRKQVTGWVLFSFSFKLMPLLNALTIQIPAVAVRASHLPTCPGSMRYRGNGRATVRWELITTAEAVP